MRPINKILIARPIEKKEAKSTLILPEKERNTLVFEVTEAADNPHGIKAGDKILISRYKTTEVEIEDEKGYVMSYDDVMAVL
jgi:co-chaperonin GroES (HSP10)